MQILVLAKAPVPGRVKTRLCPPCTPQQAATVAAAALADTIEAVAASPALRRTLVISGGLRPPPGWIVRRQCGGDLGQRLARAFADTALPGAGSLLIGMDTPQITASLLDELGQQLGHADAALGPALDGGWWGLALAEPAHAEVLAGVPMSTSRTLVDTCHALRGRGLRVALASSLRDVDTAADAWSVAQACPASRFAAAVRQHVPLLPGPP